MSICTAQFTLNTHTHTHTHTYIYIYVCIYTIIIIIKSCRELGVPWLYLSFTVVLSSIAHGRSSRRHPVSAQSWCIRISAGRQTLARPYVGVHKRMLLMSSSLNSPQKCPASLVRLTRIVCPMGGKWLNSCCFVACCFQNLSKIARSILLLFPSSVYSMRFVRAQIVHP